MQRTLTQQLRTPSCNRQYGPGKHHSRTSRACLNPLRPGRHGESSIKAASSESQPGSSESEPAEEPLGQPSQRNLERTEIDPKDSRTGLILGPLSPKKQSAWQKGKLLARRTAGLVWENAWSILALFAIADGIIYLLHRLCHRITNEVALRYLLPAGIDQGVIGGNLWFLSNNPDIANFQTGYQWVVGLVFLLTFPISILLRTIAAASAQMILFQRLDVPKKNPSFFPPIRAVFLQIIAALQDIGPRLSKLWQVDLLVAVRSIPLQGLSLLLLPLPWTIPRLLNLQLAAPIALFEEEEGDYAIKSSAKMVKPVRKALALPYMGLLIGSKLLAFLGRIVLVKLDTRITVEIPEIPIAIYMLVAVLTLAINRMQDLLPFVTYTELTTKLEEVETEDPSAEPDVNMAS